MRLQQAGAHFRKAGMFKSHLGLTKRQIKFARHATRARVIVHVAGTSGSCNQPNSRVLNVLKNFGGHHRAAQLFQADSQFWPQAGGNPAQ